MNRLSWAGLALTLALAGCAPQEQQQKWAMDYIGPKIMLLLQFTNITSSSGQPESSKDFLGKVVVLYFGYTHCPDVCPTTMAHLARAEQLLGAQGKDVQVIFVTVDPKRDTPKVLDAYVHAFMSAPSGSAARWRRPRPWPIAITSTIPMASPTPMATMWSITAPRSMSSDRTARAV